MKNIPTLVPVVAAALIAPDGRVLMQQRRAGAQHGGLWEFPGGKVEAGEGLEQSLCRELEEELGIRVDPEALTPFSFAALPGEPVLLLLFLCRSWQGNPQCLDAAAVGWFDPVALLELPMPPLDVPLARAVRDLSKKAN